MKDKFIIQEFEKYLTFLKKISHDDLNSILKREKEIVFEIRDKSSKLKNRELLIGDEIEKIINKLGSVEKREDGINYIETLNLMRIDIENILKKLDTHFTKKDSIPRLKEKLIESTIGFKLRSEAIQKKV
ncbi:hypothetical protein PYS58_16415 [Chryseobacterium indologenes]|uniref:hypothetical protein n=1 Tax=Chryseobacterium indologenes TaxID=253 RepID=UPI0023E79F5F|nr:hypothetical protein [Chryseobacterium indologenes]WET48149.1 hypothetical protein PYS58_16415 [Chryseobacterium indologenes]